MLIKSAATAFSWLPAARTGLAVSLPSGALVRRLLDGNGRHRFAPLSLIVAKGRRTIERLAPKARRERPCQARMRRSGGGINHALVNDWESHIVTQH